MRPSLRAEVGRPHLQLLALERWPAFRRRHAGSEVRGLYSISCLAGADLAPDPNVQLRGVAAADGDEADSLFDMARGLLQVSSSRGEPAQARAAP